MRTCALRRTTRRNLQIEVRTPALRVSVCLCSLVKEQRPDCATHTLLLDIRRPLFLRTLAPSSLSASARAKQRRGRRCWYATGGLTGPREWATVAGTICATQPLGGGHEREVGGKGVESPRSLGSGPGGSVSGVGCSVLRDKRGDRSSSGRRDLADARRRTGYRWSDPARLRPADGPRLA